MLTMMMMMRSTTTTTTTTTANTRLLVVLLLQVVFMFLLSPPTEMSVSGFVVSSIASQSNRQNQHQKCSSSPPSSSLIICWAKSKNKKKSRRSSSGGSGGGGGFGVKIISKKNPALDKKAVLKKVQAKYGGTTAEEIAQATQQHIQTAMKQLPPHMQMAIQLHQQLQQWNAHMASLSVLQQANIAPAELEGAKRAQAELERLYQEHDDIISPKDIHNVLQKITWDASADAKAARSVTGNMPADIAARVDRACQIVADAVSTHPTRSCLDVGCGFGVLVPHLIQAGVEPPQIYGVDLSPEMIRNAREMHPTDRKTKGPTFEAVDFLSDEYQGPPQNDGDDSDDDDDDEGAAFDSVIFCSSLHDMPDVIGSLQKASHLLRPDGKLVLVHPQGASHVLQQVRSNPALVTRGLPDAKELQSIDSDELLELIVEPAAAGSKQETQEGYLAVLQKKMRGTRSIES